MPVSDKNRRFIQYTGMGLEMGVLIFIGVWLGKRVDLWLQMEKPVFMLIGVLLFTLAAIYRVIKSLG
ncbi:MAG: AtpZ/AtpI family protein [Saprospiraceae bacterium]|nr:AtpZ/AtpI family protein [Saprospiraceae bacterium]